MTASPEALTLRYLYTATAIGWVAAELRQSRKRRSNATARDAGSMGFLRTFAVLGAIAASIAAHEAPGADLHPRLTAAWIGLAVLVCGIGLRLWCFRALGQYFTFTVQTSGDQQVVSTGPYRIVRHPSYLAILIALVGVGLSIGNWAALVALEGFTLIGLVRRIRVEEQALLGELGERYASYASGRKRLVPYVW